MPASSQVPLVRANKCLALLFFVVTTLGSLGNSSTPVGLDGKDIDVFAATDADVVALFFIAVECPIANRYAPLMSRLSESFSPRDVAFWGVYADPSFSLAEMRTHHEEHALSFRAVFDPELRLVAKAGATVTPEVAVFLRDHETGEFNQLAYRGRIDNQYVNFGKWRRVATTQDLADALEAILADEAVAEPRTRAVGCYLPEY